MIVIIFVHIIEKPHLANNGCHLTFAQLALALPVQKQNGPIMAVTMSSSIAIEKNIIGPIIAVINGNSFQGSHLHL